MRPFRDLPIRSKLTLVIMATCSAAMLVGAIAVTARYVRTEQDHLARRVTILAKVVATNSASALAFTDPAGAAQTLAALSADPGVLGAEIRDARGAVFARFRAPAGNAHALAAVDPDLDEQNPAEPTLLARSMRVVQPIVLDGERIGSVAVEVDLGPLHSGLLLDVGVITLGVVIAGLIALLLATRLQRFISQPITRLAAAMQQVSLTNDYSQRVASAGKDEVGTMVDGFNRMLDQIQLRDKALDDSCQQLQSAQRIARIGDWQWHASSGLVELSDQARRVLGIDSDLRSVTLEAFIARVHEADRERVRSVVQTSLATGVALDTEHRIVADGGTVEFVHQRGQVSGSAGSAEFAGTVQNVSERARAKEELLIAASALESTADSVMVIDARQHVLWVNKAFGAMTGYARAHILGRSPELLRSDRHPEAFYVALWQQVNDEGHWQGEIWSRRRNGTVYPQRVTVNRIADRSDRASNFVCVASDISSRKRQEAQLEFLAHHDTVTGLPNRAMFETRLAQATERATVENTMGCVMFVDLDNFKQINDTRGHAAGDRLLRAAATRLRRCVRTSDLVARLGGDEFALLLEGLSCAEDAADVAAKVVDALAMPFELGGPEMAVSASVGIGLFPRDGEDAQTVLQSADHAMYRIKAKGRNGYQFFSRPPDRADAAPTPNSTAIT